MNRLQDFLATRWGAVVWYGLWALAIFGLSVWFQHLGLH